MQCKPVELSNNQLKQILTAMGVSTDNKIVLTSSQQKVFDKMKAFTKDNATRVFILTGYAGTGKTTLLKEFFQWLRTEMEYANILNGVTDGCKGHYVPMASTGRAAKIIKDRTGELATTVHSQIYNFKGFNKDIETVAESISKNKGVDKTGELFINFDFSPISTPHSPTIYIIDEASMLTDKETVNATQAIFGTGHVLDDLINYDPYAKYVFVGDPCQLPPINDNHSPALDHEYMAKHYNITVQSGTLTQIIRQKSSNDIILSAEKMRKLCNNPPDVKWGMFPMRGFRHIHLLPSQMQLVHDYVCQVKANGYNYATMLTRSNKDCNMLASLIRPQLGFTSPLISVGELLLVTQNHIPTGFMNGDLVKVVSIGNRIKRAELTFVDVQFEDMTTNRKYRSLLIEELLYSNNSNLTQQEQKGLFIDFYYRERDKGVSQKSQQFNTDMYSDPFLNALRASFGYVLTCHKAQGRRVAEGVREYSALSQPQNAEEWLSVAVHGRDPRQRGPLCSR